MSSIKVVANISESNAGKVSIGDVVKIEFPDINKTITTRITFASNFIDQLNSIKNYFTIVTVPPKASIFCFAESLMA